MHIIRYLVMCVCQQKTAYEMRISDWSSDVCSSDLFLDPALDLFLVRLRHDGAVMRLGIGRYADAQRLDRGDQLGAQAIRGVLADRDNDRQRHAAQIGREPSRERECPYE